MKKMRRKSKSLLSLLLTLILMLNMGSLAFVSADAATTDAYKGKVFSILGDSISTFEGYIPVADGFNAQHHARYPQSNLLTEVNDTWWMQVITELGGKLGINDSWKGTTVFNAETQDVNGNNGKKATISSPTRIKNLGANGTPDVIMFYGGTNDFRQEKNLGTFNKATATPIDENVDWKTEIWTSVVDAYVATIKRLHDCYPEAQIIALLPTYNLDKATTLTDKYSNMFETICKYYEIPYVDVRDCEFNTTDKTVHLPDNIHPNAAGMDLITDAVLNLLKSNKVSLEAGEHIVHEITHELSGAKATLGHWHGVDANKSFTEKITGDNKDAVAVLMNGEDITSQSYNPTTGEITVANVTGPLLITTDYAEHSDNKVVLDKKATLENDGTYSIDLSGQVNGKVATSSVNTQVPLDVVMVLDASSSMTGYKKEYQQVTVNGTEVQAYPSGVTKETNLWDTDLFKQSSEYYAGEKLVVGVQRRYISAAEQAEYEAAFKEYMANNGYDFAVEFVAYGEYEGNGNNSGIINTKDFYTWINKNKAILDVVIGVGKNIKEGYGGVTVDIDAYALHDTDYQPAHSGDTRYAALLKDKNEFSSVLFYNFISQGNVAQTNKYNTWKTNKLIEGSITIPVLPHDRIRCSSFNQNSDGGSAKDGIRVTFFDENGKVLETWDPEKVYTEYTRKRTNSNNDEVSRNYISVPDGAVAMNIPVWKIKDDNGNIVDGNNKNIFIYNLDVKEKYTFDPPTDELYENMRVKILQKQVEQFAENLRANQAKYGQEHKLSIVTFGGGDDDKTNFGQGYYYNHVAVNGSNMGWFTNTGLFVNGKFKNYARSEDKYNDPVYTYKPVYADELDENASYIYLKEGTQENTTAKEDYRYYHGSWATVTYDSAKGVWFGDDGKVVTPRATPYDSKDNVLFLERHSKAVPSVLTANDYENSLSSVMGENNLINPAIEFATDRIVARGGTDTKFGLEMANNVLENNPQRTTTDKTGEEIKSKQVVILFTDGETDNTENNYGEIFNHANSIKDKDADIYVVSVGTGKLKWMDQISSNTDLTAYDSSKALTNGQYYLNTGDITNLQGVFESITNDLIVSENEIQMGADSVMKDVLAEGLTLPENFGYNNIEVSTVDVSVPNGITYIDGEKQVFTSQGDGTYVNGTETLNVSFNKDTGTISVTGFDYSSNYITSTKPGKKLVVKITGVEADNEAVTNTVIDTNNKGELISGITYTSQDGTTGLYEFQVPHTYLGSKSYVVDYARNMTIDPADFNMTRATSLDKDSYKYFSSAGTSIEEEYGNVNVLDDKVVYTPTKINWNGFDTFYVFGKTDNETVKAASANENGNMWAKVNVIPANNVYYEDTFVTTENTKTVGIEYSGEWTTDGTDNNQAENAESDENTSVGGGVHGWEDTLANDKTHSAGSAHVSTTAGATATFTFTGTGVDIYSRTNKTTGIVIAMLYKGDSTKDSKGNNLMAEYTLMSDNLSASGDYYQVPTLSLSQIPDKNGNMVDLEYGTYTVMIIVSNASASQTGSERSTYYLDGIRVYNPIQNLEGNDIVSSAYGDEINASFVEIRDKLLDAKSFVGNTETSNGPVFIDRITDSEGNHTDNTTSNEIGNYEVYGPKNEVYLTKGQTVAFAVEPVDGVRYYIGMKSLTGKLINTKLSNGAEVKAVSIDHTADMYYEVVPNANGIISITNDSTETGLVLSLTKLKVTGAPDVTAATFTTVRNSALLSYVNEVANSDTSDSYILGDIDNDDLISVRDATRVSMIIVGLFGECTDDDILRADVDKDGALTVKDATALQRYLVSLDDGLNIGKTFKYLNNSVSN